MTKSLVNNGEQLRAPQKVEAGKWTRIYEGGYGAVEGKVSVHYFQSESGKVFNMESNLSWGAY